VTLSGIDVWVLEVMKEVAKDVATYITIRELKQRLPERVPKEKRGEFVKRLSNTFSMLSRSGSRISDRDVFLKLSSFPGMMRILQDEEFRKTHMKLDTGNGIVVLDEGSKDVMLTSRMSMEHMIISCLEGWNREYLWPAFTVSLPGTLIEIEGRSPEGQARTSFSNEYSRFETEAQKERFELETRIRKVVNLEIPVTEYESEVKETLTEFSHVIDKYVSEYEKLMNLIYPSILQEVRREIGYRLFSLHLRMITLISGLDLMAKIYKLEWSGRGYWPMFSLERLGNLTIRFLVQ